jgi:SSS family solute:Na+ symporter
MSSLSSLFNSCASLFTVDVYKKLHPQASEKLLVHIGRMATGVIVVLGLLWIPIMPLIAKGGLYKYLQSVQGYLAPPITAVFLLGLFCKRINAKGAVAGLSVGFAAGMAKLTIQGMAGAGKFAEGSMLEFIGNYNFLFASGWLLAISVVVVVAVSLLSAPPQEEQIKNLTYSTATPEQRKENRESWNKWDVLATAGVLGLVLTMYLYFSFWLK